MELYLEASTDALNYADANSVGLRLFRRTKRMLLSFGFDRGNAPIYLLGFVPPERIVLPNFSIGFIL